MSVFWNALKTSPNLDINAMWALTSNGSSTQYDQYSNTEQALADDDDHVNHELTSRVKVSACLPFLKYSIVVAYGPLHNRTCLKIYSVS